MTVTIGTTAPPGAAAGGVGHVGDMYATAYALSGAATGAVFTKIRLRVQNNSSSPLALRGVIYDSSNHLVDWGETTLAASAPDQIVEIPLSAGAAASNGSTYKIGIQGSTTGLLYWLVTSGVSTTTFYWNVGAVYGAAPPSPWSPTGSIGWQIAAEADVDAPAPAVPPDPPGISIALDAPTMAPAPAWTRIDNLAGCRVRGYTIDRGRPTEFEKTGTGTATIRIVDRQGLFDPTNTLSPYAGKMQPGKQANIALHNPVNGTWHTLFRGYVESWRYVLDPTRQYMELELQLTDGFAILARYMLQVGVDGVIPLPAEIREGNVGYGETAGTVGDRILAVLGDAGWPSELATDWIGFAPGTIPDIFSGNVRVGPKAYAAGTSALDALWDAADGEFPNVGLLFMSSDGHVRFRGRQARFRPDVAQYGIVRRTVGDDSVWTDIMQDPLNEVVPLAELEWSNGDDNLFNSCTATPQGVGTGTAWRPLDPAVDDVAAQVATAPASITAYGLRGLTFDNLQTIEGKATGNDALTETLLFAAYYVENYADPYPRITRMVFKTRHPNNTHAGPLWEHLCNCEISDLLTLKTDHPGGGGFDTDFYVEGIHYTVRPGAPGVPVVELSLDVSPRAHWTTNPFDSDPDPTF